MSIGKKLAIAFAFIASFFFGIAITLIYINQSMKVVYFIEDRNNTCAPSGTSLVTSNNVEVIVDKDKVDSYISSAKGSNLCTYQKYRWQIY